jgi:ABC-type Fe3+/spermidine/putrescine transport system ATPase subunit
MASTDAPYLAISDVRKSYKATVALHGVSLTVERGAFTVLLGESGCGKSTLLKIIAGLLTADSGAIGLDGVAIDGQPAHRRDIGLVFQNYALFPHMSVAENVRFGLDMRGIGGDEAATRIREALALVKLDGFEARKPAELSGGQQQRVALARAIVIRPRLLLLDEPLSNLDAVLRSSVRVEIRELHQRTGLTTIMVTHDQAEAMTLADRIAVMKDGRILQHDTPERIYEDPAQAFVASFVGSPPAALVRVRRQEDGVFDLGGSPWWPLDAVAAALPREAPGFTLGLRPERLGIVSPDMPGAIRGRIRSVEYLGAERLIYVDIGSERAIVRSAGPVSDEGGEVGIALDGAPPVFDAATGLRIRAGSGR